MKERVFISPPVHSDGSRDLFATSIDVAVITSTFQLMVESFREPNITTKKSEDLVIDVDFDHHLLDDELHDPLVDELDFTVEEYEWPVQVKGQKIGSIRGAMMDNLEDLDRSHQWIVSVSIAPNFPEYFAEQVSIKYPDKLPSELAQNDPDTYWILWKNCLDEWKNLLPSTYQNRHLALITHIKVKIKAKGPIKLEILDANKNLF
jgi:hypothetical protein